MRKERSARDPLVELWIPDTDTPDPEFTLAVPALNESITIRTFVQWCQEGIQKSGIQAEIVIIDSSTDDTPQIALQAGARVVRTPRRGLGRAYTDAVPFFRGKYLIFGDSDCTYDFRELAPFVEALRMGQEFVMGSRFRGTIQPGAMPALHRYFGNPATTWFLNLLYGTRFTDIHCGMRAISRAAFSRLEMESQSWQYASEMVLKAAILRLRTTEVPIHFLKDVEGRVSHHIRTGWLSPWKAGIQNVMITLQFWPRFLRARLSKDSP